MMVARLFLSFVLLLQVTVLATAQNVGINMPIPTAPLHVVRLAPTSGPKSNHVMAILESDDESFIQLSNPENAATGFLSGDRWTSIRSSLIFAGDSSILLKSGGDNSRMIINKKGRVGINTMSPLAQLHVADSSVIFSGPHPSPPTPSDPPASGPGNRMMWYPAKSALRSGTVNNTKWNKENIGTFSVGMGYDVMAKGTASVALGAYTAATGSAAVALGHSAEAKGDLSTAFNWTIAKSYASFAIGTFNDTSSLSSLGWHPNDPLFIIGNGTSYNNRNNALTVLKNGKTGLNTANPQSMLHVIRNGSSTGPYAVNAIATFESNSSSWIHLKHPTTAQAGILSGNEETSVRSGLLFDTDSSMLFRTGGNYNRMKLSKSGFLGINTTTPKSLLHIRLNGSSGGNSHALSFATLESNINGYLQFSQANNAEAGILSGNAASEIRSAVVFGTDSSMHFRTGGNYNRILIDKLGRTGIGTNTPKAMLHVLEGSAVGGLHQPSAMAIFERGASSYLQMITPANEFSGIIATDPYNDIRNGILFAGNGGIEFLSGGNSNPRIKIDASGKMGFNISNPSARLDVAGSFRLGHWGAILSDVMKQSISIDLPAIAGGTSYTTTIPITAVNPDGTVHVSPDVDLPDGIVIAYARTIEDNVKIKFTNITPSSINPGNITYHITVIQ